MERLRELLLARGAALVGYADLGELYPEVRYHLPRALSIAVAVDPHIIADLAAGPTREYFNEYNRVNQQLNDLAALAADYLASPAATASRPSNPPSPMSTQRPARPPSSTRPSPPAPASAGSARVPC